MDYSVAGWRATDLSFTVPATGRSYRNYADV